MTPPPINKTAPPPPSMASASPRQAQPAVASASSPYGKLARHTPTATGARVVLTAVEGWGKTSSVATIPNAAIIQVQGETGYETLLRAGRVPAIDYATTAAWGELLSLVNDAASSKYAVLGIDALGGAERLCHEFVCARDFRGKDGQPDWSEKGFMGFMRGYEISIAEWLKLLAALDRAREGGTHIILLSHCKVATFKNPEGPDFDRYTSDVHHKTWGATHKWADAVLFGKFETILDEVKTSKAGAKGKGIGVSDRVLYTQRRDTWDAKNRYGMEESIDIKGGPETVWALIQPYLLPKGAQQA